MSIFKKASVAPIVRTVISQGIDDENNTDPAFEQAELGKQIDDSWSKHLSQNMSNEEKVADWFNYEYKHGNREKALLIARFHFQGYRWSEIRDMLLGSD